MLKPFSFAIGTAAAVLLFGACGGGSSSGSTGGASGSAGAGSGGSIGSAGANGNGGNPAGGGPVQPIGLSPKDLATTGKDAEAALNQLVGKYDVVVYYTAKGKEADLGAGSIDVAYDGDKIRLTLKTGGATVVQVANSRKNPVDYGQAAFTQVIGKILVDDRSSAFQRIDLTLLAGGSVSGYVGGSGEFYRFRNNVIHYGPTLPAHLLAQVGTWAGPQLALTCNQPPVTVVIASDGSVALSGKANLDCSAAEIKNAWDGQDDYVVPTPGKPTNVDIVIDSFSGGGSQSSGGVSLTVDADAKVPGLVNAKTVLAGAQGNLEVANPTKQ